MNKFFRIIAKRKSSEHFHWNLKCMHHVTYGKSNRYFNKHSPTDTQHSLRWKFQNFLRLV